MTIESLKSINTKNQLDENFMKLFLDSGNKLNLFETIKVNVGGDEKVRYKNYNAIRGLSVVINKIASDDELKNKFEDIIKSSDKNEVVRFISDVVLQCWLEYSPSEYTKERVFNYKQVIFGLQNIKLEDIPVIPDQIIPNWYGKKEPENLIHKEFESELSRLKGIKEGADKITQESKNHKFDRGNNDAQIHDLESQL